ncbi:hypothetical protein P4V73_11430 [Brevibacillus centrosporus]|nr:hypothetical protein [Brevibacillus centrosporus]
MHVETRIISGILSWDQENKYFLETLMENRYFLVLPQIITLTQTDEKLATDELNESHKGKSAIARCFV